jgi:hypothetical protein
MKKKKIFRFFVYFVILLFLLGIPGMYITYIFLPTWNREYYNIHDNINLNNFNSSWDDENDDVFKQIQEFVNSWSGNNLTWSILSWNNIFTWINKK